MALYPTAAVADNLLDPLSIPTSTWSTRRRLRWTRDDNPRHGSGRGARRRSAYEHQLDELLLLVAALDDPSATVLVGRHRCRARRRQFITPDVPMECRCKVRQLRPWELLYSDLQGRSRVIAAYRRRMGPLAQWLRDNHPRVGWAEPMPKRRARAVAEATGWYLRAACWSLFHAYRRVARVLVELLRTLDRWWWSLLPVPRRSAPTAKPEGPSYAPSAPAQRRAQVSDEVQATETARGAPPGELDAVADRLRARLHPERFATTPELVQRALLDVGARMVALARQREAPAG